jgi:predicted metal-dependent peptidase
MVKSEISAKLEESTINPNPAYFNLDGIEPYPGYQSNFSFNILLGIDTSGSVSDDEYKEFMAEVLGILKQEDGVSVRKILFDAAIQHEEIVTSEGVLPDRYTYRYGYGGTSFEPFLKYSLGKDTAEDWTQEAKKANVPFVMPDLVLLFTDGYAPIGPSPNGPIPQYSPACPLIWVLTPTGKEDPLMESRVIRIKR